MVRGERPSNNQTKTTSSSTLSHFIHYIQSNKKKNPQLWNIFQLFIDIFFSMNHFWFECCGSNHFE
jgi:hypothetical protein